MAIQLHALSRALSMRELQPPEVDEEEAIRRATAASLCDFTQPSHERRREDSDEVEQRSPIYDKVNFWFLAKLPDLLPESVTVPIDMYKCETIYDLMVKISQWTMRRVKVSEMILELDGEKIEEIQYHRRSWHSRELRARVENRDEETRRRLLRRRRRRGRGRGRHPRRRRERLRAKRRFLRERVRV